MIPIPAQTQVLLSSMSAGAQMREAADKAKRATFYMVGAGLVAFWLIRRWARA